MSIYDYSVKNSNGEDIKLSDYKGKVMLIVNTATGCGFTPQYAQLEQLYKDYKDKGFEIIDIPCNQFGGQTPGNDEEIHQFCTLNYDTTFPQMKKSEVNGENELPLYTYLKSQKTFETFGDSDFAKKMDQLLTSIDPDYKSKPDIKWNFTKFVVDKNGNVVKRFEPTIDMKEIDECIKSLL